MQLFVDGFYNLTDAGQPTAQLFRPRARAVPLGWADELCPIVEEPLLVTLSPFESFVRDVGSQGRQAHAWQPGMGLVSRRKEGLGQQLVLTTTCAEAKASDDACWIDRDEQTKPFKPAELIDMVNSIIVKEGVAPEQEGGPPTE